MKEHLLALKFPRIRHDFLFRAVKGISFIIAPNTAALSYREIMSAGIYPARAEKSKRNVLHYDENEYRALVARY